MFFSNSLYDGIFHSISGSFSRALLTALFDSYREGDY